MKHLSHGDLETLLAAINNLNASNDLQTLPERALSTVSRIIHADSVAFTGFSSSGEYAGIGWENSEAISPSDLEVFVQYMHENPLFAAFVIERRTETLKITDLISLADFKRTNVYNEFYRRVGVTNQLVTPMTISDDLVISCSINTVKEDFSDRDKLILTLIAPHIANAVRNSFAYDRLSSALDTEERGIIAVNSKGKPLFISEYARRLLAKYFAEAGKTGNSLPETVVDWLKQIQETSQAKNFNLPTEALKIEKQKDVLSIRLMHNSTTRERTLLLEEKQFVNPQIFENFNLTKRENEILSLITQGKTDDAIAQLCGISLRTVHKHVEHIYTKLGVETRTGAMLKIFETK
jgi:DNA-binding CsgD family transcriptional regulator